MEVQLVKSRKEIMMNVLEVTFIENEITFSKIDNEGFILEPTVKGYGFIMSVSYNEEGSFTIISAAFNIVERFKVHSLHQFFKFLTHCVDKWVELKTNFSKGELHGMMIEGYLSSALKKDVNVLIRSFTNGNYLEIKVEDNVFNFPCDINANPANSVSVIEKRITKLLKY